MAENFTAEAFSLLAISLVVIALRWVSRLLTVGFWRLAADDYLMIIAGALYSAETTLAYYVGQKWKGFANTGMTPEQRANLDPHGEEYRLRVGGSKNQIAGWVTYTTLLWALKTCMLIFYSRLTDGVKDMRMRIRVGAILLGVTYLATVLSILLGCQPFHRQWQINPDPGNLCQPAISKLNVAALLSLNIATDFYLMSVPLPMIWGSRLAVKKKWVLSIMFSGGLLVMVAGILRCVLILNAGINGPAQAGEWSIRESFIAVVVGNLPMLYTLLQRLQQHGSNSWHKSSDRRSYPLSSYRSGASSKMAKKVKKFQHPLSMPNDTAMDSDERIVVESKQDHHPPPGFTASGPGGRSDYNLGRSPPNHDNVIRVQTDLHVESFDESRSENQRRHDHDQFQISRV